MDEQSPPSLSSMDLETIEREMEARRHRPEYELKIICRLQNEKALQTLMIALAEVLYQADPMAAFGGGLKLIRSADSAGSGQK